MISISCTGTVINNWMYAVMEQMMPKNLANVQNC